MCGFGCFGFDASGGSGGGGTISGSGTLNYIPKFTPDGITIGNSQFFDDGTNVGLGTITPTAKLHLLGVDSTSGNYVAKFQNSVSSNIAIFRNDGIINFGNATTTNQRLVRIGQNSSFIDLGSYTGNSNIPAIYMNESTPGSGNYALLSFSSYTALNNFASVKMRINNNDIFTSTGTDMSFVIRAASSGVSIPYTFTTPNSTGQTAGAETMGFDLDMSATITHASNTTITLNRDGLVQPRTHAWATPGGGVGTNFATWAITGAPKGGTNAALANVHGILIQAGSVANGATPTNSYGLTVNAQTGATNNYAAQFLGGNVGFGISSPTKTVDITGDIQLNTAGNGIYIKQGTNATFGLATLVGGTVVINTTKITANSVVVLTGQGGDIINLGSYSITARTAGTSFTISSSNVLDVNTVGWLIIEPSI
jgi:hypothetical protein